MVVVMEKAEKMRSPVSRRRNPERVFFAVHPMPIRKCRARPWWMPSDLRARPPAYHGELSTAITRLNDSVVWITTTLALTSPNVAMFHVEHWPPSTKLAISGLSDVTQSCAGTARTNVIRRAGFRHPARPPGRQATTPIGRAVQPPRSPVGPASGPAATSFCCPRDTRSLAGWSADQNGDVAAMRAELCRAISAVAITVGGKASRSGRSGSQPR